MAEIVKMPRLSDTMTDGVVSKWHKKEGDEIKNSLREKLYMPVQRENKIKVVRVSSGVKVGGF